MRYFFAILSLTVAAVLLALGIGQRTFLSPPTSVKHEIPLSADSQYVVIPADVFALEKGNPSVVVSGERVFLALGERRDIDGWLDPYTHDVVTADPEKLTLTTKTTQPTESGDADEEVEAVDSETGDDDVSMHPEGSDLWLSEYTGETSVKVAVSPEATQAVLVTSGEEATAPDEVYVIWAQERNTPLAGPLLATGGLFAALGIILYLVAVDHDRRGLGPRRGRRGPFQGLRNRRVRRARARKRRIQSDARRGSRLGYSLAGAATLALVVTGCSPSYWPQPEASQPEEVEEVVDEHLAVVPVTDQQIDKILERVVGVASEADEELDAAKLESRFEGPALTERAANYKMRAATAATTPLPYLTTERLRYDLVQSTEKWPRTLFLTVQSSDEIVADDTVEEEAEPEDGEDVVDLPEEEKEQTPTMVLLLTQEDPHENYKVRNIVSLRGGIEMPAAAPLDEGTAVLANDIKTLRLAPKDAASAFAEILQQGVDGVETATVFALEEDPLLQKFGASWPAENCIEGLKCAQSVKLADEPVTTLSTGQGGALVMATLNELHDMEIESERDQVKLSEVEKALGLDGSYSKVTRQWQHNILLFVPNADSEEPIQVLGSSTQVVGAYGTEKEGD